MQAAMMRCALGSDPAKAALRVLHSWPEGKHISAIDREKTTGTSQCVYRSASHLFRCFVHELNHNVAVWFRKLPDFTPVPANQKLPFVLLHPYDATLTKELIFDVSKLNDSDEQGWPNFMTSKELDEYTVDGKYYVA
jgi:hypothetical protein